MHTHFLLGQCPLSWVIGIRDGYSKDVATTEFGRTWDYDTGKQRKVLDDAVLVVVSSGLLYLVSGMCCFLLLLRRHSYTKHNTPYSFYYSSYYDTDQLVMMMTFQA